MGAFFQIAIACTVFLVMRVFLSATMYLGMSERGLAGFYAPLPYNLVMTGLNAVKSFLAALAAVLCCRVVGDVASATAITLRVFAFILGLGRAAFGVEEALIPWISVIAALSSTGVTFGAIALGSRLTLS